MAQNITAYFKNENDVESVHALLQKLQVSDIVVDKVPQDEHVISGPFAPFNNINSGDTLNPGRAFFPIQDFDNTYAFSNSDNEEPRSYMLEFQVADEQYEQAIAMLKEKDAKINPTDL